MNNKNKWNINPFDGYNGQLDWLERNTIFATVHGSQAYGTSTPTSDIDIKGLVIPPKEYFFGYLKKFEQAESNKPYDMVLYGLRKFIKLAADCNPNIIEVLHTDPEDWLISTPIFQKLYDNRYLFISKKARHTFSGYAFSQLKRIKSHRNWLLNPPDHKPTREEYGLPENKKMSNSDMGAVSALIKNDAKLDDKVMKLYHQEQAYQGALRNWNQYQHWRENRNPARAELEEKYGFDAKHAGHLVRLMRMCYEILEEGKVHVKRSDAEELKAIRSGAWSYDHLIEWAENQEEKIKELYNTSTLPNSPDRNKIDELCVDLVEEFLELS